MYKGLHKACNLVWHKGQGVWKSPNLNDVINGWPPNWFPIFFKYPGSLEIKINVNGSIVETQSDLYNLQMIRIFQESHWLLVKHFIPAHGLGTTSLKLPMKFICLPFYSIEGNGLLYLFINTRAKMLAALLSWDGLNVL